MTPTVTPQIDSQVDPMERNASTASLSNSNDTHDFLKGQHAIVTGGGRGIGRAIATALARRGAQLTLMGRTETVVTEHATRLTNEYQVQAIGVSCDVSQPESVREAFAKSIERFGTPYVLVNNAGQGASAAFEQTTTDIWDRMLAVNLTGTFLCIQQVLPHMHAAHAGRIINIASTAGLKGYSHVAAYCASKHGVVGLTRSLATETAKQGITVNAVCPAYTDTDLATHALDTIRQARRLSADEARKMLVRGIPLGRLITPDEVANTVDWLCSPLASAITGQSIAVAGGEVM